MTDPTPTRAEVEAAVEKLANSHLGMSLVEWNAVSNTILTCAAENQALRERAEAAERAEVAAWNDAIEAADKAAIDRQGRRAMGDGHGNSCYDIGVSDAASAIRALRRAAPTEGEA